MAAGSLPCHARYNPGCTLVSSAGRLAASALDGALLLATEGSELEAQPASVAARTSTAIRITPPGGGVAANRRIIRAARLRSESSHDPIGVSPRRCWAY